jgi:hypothetical protein
METSPGDQFQSAGGEEAAGVQDSVAVHKKPPIPPLTNAATLSGC